MTQALSRDTSLYPDWVRDMNERGQCGMTVVGQCEENSDTSSTPWQFHRGKTEAKPWLFNGDNTNDNIWVMCEHGWVHLKGEDLTDGFRKQQCTRWACRKEASK